VDNLLPEFDDILKEYQYDHYYLYPSINAESWKHFLLQDYKRKLNNSNCAFFPNDFSSSNVLLHVHSNKWDEDLMGFKIGKIDNPLVATIASKAEISKYVKELVDYSRMAHFRVLIARINGDNLKLIHALTDFGFRYYETIIWPVIDIKNKCFNTENVCFFNTERDDAEELFQLARGSQFSRGHFQCDSNFDIKKINDLYVKWVETAVNENRKITIIRHDGKITGFFVCNIDKELSDCMGYSYGRLQSLAVDSSRRGHGYGRKLFEGTIGLLQNEGCKFVDSGYATKNHLSAKLHSTFGFHSMYEEITLHFWL
jgi:L-amino acid N-acyltransferase YncA